MRTMKIPVLILLMTAISCSDRFHEDELQSGPIIPVRTDYYVNVGNLLYIDISHLFYESEFALVEASEGEVWLDQEKKRYSIVQLKDGKSYQQAGSSGILYKPGIVRSSNIDTIRLSTDLGVKTFIIHITDSQSLSCMSGAQTDFVFLEESNKDVDVSANDHFCIEKDALEFYKDYWFAEPMNGQVRYEMAELGNGLNFKHYFIKEKETDNFIDAGLVVIYNQSNDQCTYNPVDDSGIVKSGEITEIDVMQNDMICEESNTLFERFGVRSIKEGYFLDIDKMPNHGTVYTKKGKLVYQSDSGYHGFDEILYYLNFPGLDVKKGKLRVYVE